MLYSKLAGNSVHCALCNRQCAIAEGKRGFCAAFANTYDVKAITTGIGDDVWIMGVSLKPYSCNGNIIPAIRERLRWLEQNRAYSGKGAGAKRISGRKVR